MKKSYSIVIFILLFFLGNSLFGQTNISSNAKQINAKVEVTHAEYLGTTPPIRDLVPLNATDKQKRKLSKKNRRAPKDFPGRGRNTIVRPDLEHQGPDPVRQTGFNPESVIPVEPLVNVQGLTSGFAPNDPSGDIGENHYVQAINATTIGVFDKEGTLENTFTGNSLWGSIGFSSAGDPIVLYDQEANRWIITEFPNGNQLLVGVSATSDPMSAYDVYNFSTPSFPDYPKYGIWKDVITVTTNEGGAGNLSCYLIDKNALFAGAASVDIQRIELPGNTNTEAGFFVATPVDWSGSEDPNSDPLFIALNDSSWGQSTDDQVEIYSVNVDFVTPANTTITNSEVVLSPYDGFPCSALTGGFACVPQQGGGGLDAIPEVIMNQAHYRNFGSHETMVFNFITDATNGDNVSGIRWVELRRTGGGDWTLYQEGTFAPNDGFDRFMAGIAIDGSGNIGLAYNVTSANSFVGVNFTGRRASDALGEMTVDEFVAATGSNSINSGGRFGDYGQMSVDPSNDRTFWYTTEYANSDGGGDVNTQILAFELRRDTNDIGPSALITPQNSPDLTNNEIVTVDITNFGIEAQQVYQVGYIFENGTPVIENVNSLLEPEAVYQHTFATPIDVSVVDDYDMQIFTILASDTAPLNDTLRTVISKLPRWDAGISNIEGLDGSNCEDEIPANILLSNYGTETLTSTTIEVMLNGTLFQTIPWTGSLPSGESIAIPVTITGFINGMNEISASTSLPNNMTDEVMSNDNFARNFNAILGGVTVVLNLQSDFYADEITWEITDANSNILYSGGPYNQPDILVTEEFCLDPTACYTFTIADSYGDGICCNYGDGNYSINDANGNVLLAGDGQYGYGESNGFCATFECTLDAEFNISPESAVGVSDGSILVSPMNGTGPFQFSIDGGMNFQNSPIFNNLPAGNYTILVQGGGCEYEETVTVESCVLGFSIAVENEVGSGAMNGSITITVGSGNTPYQYSIDGGQTFQTSNIFSNLPSGEYTVVVNDDLGCSTSEIVMVDFETPTDDIFVNHVIEIFPNPTDGVFRINVSGLEQSSVFLKLEIYDAAGKRIQESSIVKYNDTYTGQLSLVHYSAGTYFVRFLNDDIKRMIKVVRN